MSERPFLQMFHYMVDLGNSPLDEHYRRGTEPRRPRLWRRQSQIRPAIWWANCAPAQLVPQSPEKGKARASCQERSGHNPATTYSRGTYRSTTIGG